MNMRNYMKKKSENSMTLSTDEIVEKFTKNKKNGKTALKLYTCIALVIVVGMFGLISSIRGLNANGLEEISLVTYANNPVASASAKKDTIAIPTGIVKANPFLPYRDIGDSQMVNDVPKFDLIAPPETIEAGSDAARVMDTIVSGILFDKFSPSAILNIEGNDYLVKKGDVVNNYKVLDIAKESVTVKLGQNTYKAGIGEILTEGELNKNDVSNLSKKFGGKK